MEDRPNRLVGLWRLKIFTIHAHITGFGTYSTKANEFVIGFMANPVDDPIQTVLVTTDEPLPVNFTVEASNPPLVMTETATYGSVTTLQLPKAVVVTNSSQRNKGIRIKAENGETMSVYGSNHEISSTKTFSE